MACACLFVETTGSADARTCLCGHPTGVHEGGVGACRAGAVAGYTVCAVFTGTTFGARTALGETITTWLAERPQLEVVERVVLQTSDRGFHCISVTLFLRERTT